MERRHGPEPDGTPTSSDCKVQVSGAWLESLVPAAESKHNTTALGTVYGFLVSTQEGSAFAKTSVAAERMAEMGSQPRGSVITVYFTLLLIITSEMLFLPSLS